MYKTGFDNNNLEWEICYKTKQRKFFIKMTWLGIKWSEKGWYAVKHVNQPTSQ